MGVKYTREQVLAALEAIGKPAATSTIAEQTRTAAGDPRYAPGGNGDVTDALAAMVADGTIVTAKALRYGRVEGEHGHIGVGTHHGGANVYATPQQSAAWKLYLELGRAESARGEQLIERLGELLKRQGLAGSARLERPVALPPTVSLSLGVDTLAWLVERIE